MNGNITKEGIKLDLEWMNRFGVGGFQNFDAALNTPKLGTSVSCCRFSPDGANRGTVSETKSGNEESGVE